MEGTAVGLDDYNQDYGSGDVYRLGLGYGHGYCSGEGYSDGYGYSNGYGDGSGYGEGYGSDCGYGYGCGYGSGYGVSSGDGSGYSYMWGCKRSEISGYGFICDFDIGSGRGDGKSYGNSYGDGSGCGAASAKTLIIPKSRAWDAYHYVRVCDGEYVLRDGRKVSVGKELYEPSIKMCVRGLHASLSPKDAVRYAPPNSVLTKVKVWGKLRVGVNKLVATNRKIVEVLTRNSYEDSKT